MSPIDTDALKAQVEILDVLDWLEIERPSTYQRFPKICCPLPDHSERTPSCVIYEATNSWWCFGCWRGGDVIDLAMSVKGLSFVDAAQWLARKAGTAFGSAEAPQKLATILVEPVAAQAHADVAKWVRRVGITAIEDLDSIFLDYDEIMRQYDAKEIDAKQAISRFLEWRIRWRDRFDV